MIDGVRQVDSRGVFDTVVKSACAHLSQNIFVHNTKALSVFAIESSEHCTIHGINVRAIVKLLFSVEMQAGSLKKPLSLFLIFRIFVFSLLNNPETKWLII